MQLRRKDEPAFDPAIVERLHAQPIAHEPQAAIQAFPEREGEHPHEASDGRLETPDAHAFQEHLRVGGASEPATHGRELLPQLGKVLGLAVVDDHVAIVRRDHGLAAGGSQIDD